MKVDALKIKEIARKLGVSERTVEEYLLDRLTLQEDEGAGFTESRSGAADAVVDRFGRPLEKEPR